MTSLTWSPDLRTSFQKSKVLGSAVLVHAQNLTSAEKHAATELLNKKVDVKALVHTNGSWY
jgi:hypothetical protein